MFTNKENSFIIGIFISFCAPSTSILISNVRQNQLKKALITGQIKKGNEIELALNLFLDDIDRFSQNHNKANLFQLIFRHKNNCDNNDCLCHEFDRELSRYHFQLFDFAVLELKNIQGVNSRINNIMINSQNINRNEISKVNKGLNSNQQEFVSFKIINNPSTQLNPNKNVLSQLAFDPEVQLSSFLKNPGDGEGFMMSDLNMLFQSFDKAKQKNLEVQDDETVQINQNGLQTQNEKQTKMLISFVIHEITKQHLIQFKWKNQRLMTFKSFFELKYMRNIYLCHSTLTRMVINGLSLIDSVDYLIDQQFILDEAQERHQNENQEQSYDVEKVLLNNHAFSNYFDAIRESFQQIGHFWDQLSVIKNIDVIELYDQGVKSSQAIAEAKEKFKILQEIGQDKKNSDIFLIYSHFCQNVLNNDLLCQDYLVKMKQLKRMNKNIRENYQDGINTEVDKSGFLLVNGTFNNFGSIIFANKTLCSLLDYLPEQLIGKQINTIMPQVISEKHHLFLKQFRETGVPTFIERQQQLFIKNSKGYIVPVKVLIKFHYDREYGHVYTAIINKTKFLYPFQNKLKYHSDEIMTIMTNHLGVICEISPSVTKYIGIPVRVIQENQNVLQDNMKITNLLNVDIDELDTVEGKEFITFINPDFQPDEENGKTLKNQRNKTRKKLISTIPQLKRMAFSLKRHQSNITDTSQPFMSILQEESLDIQVKVRMKKVDHKDILTVRYFFIEIIKDDIKETSQLQLIHQTQNIIEYNNQDFTLENTNNNNNMMDIDYYDQGSMSSMQQSISQTQQISKDIDNLIRREHRTPKNLKQILIMLLLCILVILVISSLNLEIFVVHIEKQFTSLNQYTDYLSVISQTSSILSLIRQFFNLKQGVNLQKASDFEIFQNYNNSADFTLEQILGQKIFNHLDILQDKVQRIQSQQLQNTKLKSNVESVELDLQNIDYSGNIYTQKQNFNIGLNLFISTIFQLQSNGNKISYYDAKLNFTNYYERYIQQQRLLSANLQESTLIFIESDLFFLYQNYINQMWQAQEDVDFTFKQYGIDNLKNDLKTIFITSLISLCTLLIVMLATTPIFYKISQQKYQVLSFFIDLDNQVIKECQIKSQLFDEQFYQTGNKRKRRQTVTINQENLNLEVGHSEDSEDFHNSDYDNQEAKLQLGRIFQAKMVAKKLKNFNRAKFQKAQTFLNDSDFDKEHLQQTIETPVDFDQLQQEINNYNSRPSVFIKQFSMQNANGEVINGENVKKKSSDHKLYKSSGFNVHFQLQQQNQSNSSGDKKNGSILNGSQNQLGEILNTIKEENKSNEQTKDINMDSKENKRKDISFLNYKQTIENDQVAGISIGQSDDMSQSHNGNLDESHNPLEPRGHFQTENELGSIQTMINNEKQEEQEKILYKIQNITSNNRSTMIISLLALFLSFATYFIGIYFLSKVSFFKLRQSFDNIANYSQKSHCINQLFLFMREDFQCNNDAFLDIKTYQYQSQSMNTYWECMKADSEFNDFKKNLDIQFSLAQEFITKIDSQDLCQEIALISEFKEASCRQIFNHLLEKGYSNTNQYIMKRVLEQLLDFFSLPKSQRTHQYIQEKLRDTEILELLYIKEFMLINIEIKLQVQLLDSIQSYIRKLKYIHYAVYSIQIVLTLTFMLFFILIIYDRLKKAMVNASTLITLLPKEQMSREIKEQIKDFLAS